MHVNGTASVAERLSFPMPQRWEKWEIAQTFTAYLSGANAFNEEHFGPLRQQKGSDDDWQLDASGDYSLHFEGGNVFLNYRQPTQRPVCEAMINLFAARYDRT